MSQPWGALKRLIFKVDIKLVLPKLNQESYLNGLLHSIWSTLMLQVTPVVVAIVKAIVNEDVDRAFSTYTIEKMTST